MQKSPLISVPSSAAYNNGKIIPISVYPNSGYPVWDQEMGVLLSNMLKEWEPRPQPEEDDMLYVGCGRRLPFLNCYCVDLDANVGQGMSHFTHADAHDLPFENERFWWTLSSHTLEHLQDCERALEEQCRVTRVGGVIGAIIPDVRWTAGLDSTHIREYAKDEFVGLFHSMLSPGGAMQIVAAGEAKEQYSFYTIWRKITR